MDPQTDERQRMGDPRVPQLQDRIFQLEAALREAMEWDWLTDPALIPDDVQKRVMDAAYPQSETPAIDPLLGDIDVFGVRGLTSETPVRHAHSKSEYKRLTALGVEYSPPETKVPACLVDNCYYDVVRNGYCARHWKESATALAEAETGTDPARGAGQKCHLCHNVHDLMSACPPVVLDAPNSEWRFTEGRECGACGHWIVPGGSSSCSLDHAVPETKVDQDPQCARKPDPCSYCFGEKIVHHSDSSHRLCEYCNGTGHEPPSAPKIEGKS